MPKKLMDCIKKVMQSGKSESEAWAICQVSTGLKKEKHAKYITQLISLADYLDSQNLPDEATSIDNILQKEAQWQWIKEKGQQFKDWVQTEREMDPEIRRQLTILRKNHWNLIKWINSARSLLTKLWSNIGKREYLRDISSVIQHLQHSLENAADIASEANDAALYIVKQQHPEHVPATPQRTKPRVVPKYEAPKAFDIEETQKIETKPFDVEETQKIEPNGNFIVIERLLKLAIKLENQGNKKIASQIDTFLKQSQLQSLQEMGQRGLESIIHKIHPEQREVAKLHWRLIKSLQNAYNILQGARQNVTDWNEYAYQFTKAIESFHEELNKILQDINKLYYGVNSTETADTKQETTMPVSETQQERIDINTLQKALSELSPDKRAIVLQLIQQMKA